jgi:hypothetical protein
LAAENRILKAQLKGRLTLSDTERATLGEIGRRLGRKLLGEVANVARPGHHPDLVPQHRVTSTVIKMAAIANSSLLPYPGQARPSAP